MAIQELSQEDVFADDKDPLEAIREIRSQAGEEISEDLEAGISENATEKVLEQQDEPDEIEELNEDSKGKLVPDEEELPKEPDIEPDTTVDETPEPEKEEGEEKSESKEEEQVKEATGPKTFKANGQEFTFTQDEINDQFEAVFGKAMDYTQKMQKIAPYRKMISALESEGITQDQLNVALDAMKGDKGALKELMKLNEIDTFDLSDDEDYTPNDYGKDTGQLAIEDITSKIDADPEYKITVDVVDNQWDNDSREVLRNNPSMIQGLHNDIKSGLYDKVAPLAMKMKVLDGNTKSNLEYYILAGQQLQQQEEATKSTKTVAQLNQKSQDAEQEFDKASSEAVKKRAAASTGSRTDRKGVIDYLDDDNDEAYDAWYKKLMASN